MVTNVAGKDRADPEILQGINLDPNDYWREGDGDALESDCDLKCVVRM